MTNQKKHYPLVKLIGVVSVITLASCATTQPREIRTPNLTYVANSDCTTNINFDRPIRQTEDPKKIKQQIRNRVIVMSSDMEDQNVSCLTLDGENLPYEIFELPVGITGRVITAGSKLDTEVIFAAQVSTHSATGELIREFDVADYRRVGEIDGVQFAPRAEEKYVLIKADPTLIGERNATVETGTRAQYVSSYNGLGVSSGTNTIGIQQKFDRMYSYNGEVVVRTVFPKQEKP